MDAASKSPGRRAVPFAHIREMFVDSLRVYHDRLRTAKSKMRRRGGGRGQPEILHARAMIRAAVQRHPERADPG